MNDRFQIRRDKLRRQLKKLGCSAMLLSDPANVTYLSGYSSDSACLLIHRDADLILSDPRYTIQISEECPGLEAFIRAPNTSMIDAIEKNLAPFAGKKIGFEADSLSVNELSIFKETVSGCDWIPTSGVIEEMRRIKDADEIDTIRKCIRSAFRAWETIRASLLPEMTEIEIRNDLEYLMRKFGATDKSFDSIIAVGERAALPHAVPTIKRVGESELLLIDWGAKIDGYVCDLTRTLITKNPSAKLRKVYETVLAAQSAAISAIKPGVTAGEIDAVARSIISDAGYGKFFTHGLGHGFGLAVHESLRIAPKNPTVLEPGMVLTVEPGVYFPAWGGVRIEDDLLVTKSGCEVLSKDVPKEFEQMIVRM